MAMCTRAISISQQTRTVATTSKANLRDQMALFFLLYSDLTKNSCNGKQAVHDDKTGCEAVKSEA